MPTIDKLPIEIYFEYARHTDTVERIQEEFHLKEASSIPTQTQVVDIFPRRSALDSILEGARVHNPWAYFTAPKKFRFQRRSPFSFSRVAPSLGSEAKLEADIAKLDGLECPSEEEQVEKGVIMKCLERLEKLNSWLGFIIGRMGQFLQG